MSRQFFVIQEGVVATGMSATHGSIDTQEAIERFADALRQRIGADRFRLWFTHGVEFDLQPSGLIVRVTSPFTADRITKHFVSELRAAAVVALGDHGSYRLLVDRANTQPSLIDDCADEGADDRDADESANNGRNAHNGRNASSSRNSSSRRGDGATKRNEGQKARGSGTGKLGKLLADSKLTSPKTTASETDSEKGSPRSSAQKSYSTQSPSSARKSPSHEPAGLPLPESSPTGGRTLESFLTGPCNEFAFSAAAMAISTPEIASPLFFHGPTGTGKSHLLSAIAEEFRRRRRMRRVILLTAEQFTNDFVSCVNSTGLPAFRRKYRDVDALLIDDVHFLASKTATLRESLYTFEALAAAGKPLVFTANLPPADIRGLTGEVAGRMSSGLVCPISPLDPATRLALLRRLVQTRCVLGCDDELLAEVADAIGGDARAVTGVSNLIGMLQRMFRREPTIDEIRQFGGDLMRNTRSAPSLRTIERAVCEAFGLEPEGLRGKAQTRRVSEPRTLAMYLARQHTGSAFTEIAQHFGRRSHSGAIAAQAKVEQWLASGKPIGGGDAAMPAGDAIARVEARLRIG